jgi:hypothetical protein
MDDGHGGIDDQDAPGERRQDVVVQPGSKHGALRRIAAFVGS